MVPLVLIQLGEITPGGIGAGFYGHVVFGAILAVFIAGLMVGRTPEYLGKKIESYEIKMAILAVLAMGGGILVFSAIATVTPAGTRAPRTPGRTASARSSMRSRARPATTAPRSPG